MKRRRSARRAVESAPRFAVITLATTDAPESLRTSLESVRSQTWQAWEHIIMVRGPGSPAVDAVLDAAAVDPRISVIRQHTNREWVDAANDALKYVTGDWVVFLHQGDTLAAAALAAVAGEVRADPAAVLVYSDWCRVGPQGVVEEVFRKPDWSPERLRGQAYLADLTAIAMPEVQDVGGFRSGFGAATEYDLILRVTERGGSVRHIPQALYERRCDRPPAEERWEAEVLAAQQHCDRIGLLTEVGRGPRPALHHLERTPRGDHSISVVIPTRGTRATAWGAERTMIVEAVRSMLEHTELPFEVVVVADEPISARYVAELRRLLGPRLVLVPYNQPFNFSDKVNLGALHASGDVLVFANDDLEIISERWLEQLTALAEEPGVGVVGALLRFEDESVQHGGHVYADGLPEHAYFKQHERAGYFDELLVDREVSGATAALVACRREVWSRVGGFSTALPGSFNDVDFCLKVRAEGYRIVQANCVQAWHFESKSRNPTVERWELELLHRRWLPAMQEERYTLGGARATS